MQQLLRRALNKLRRKLAPPVNVSQAPDLQAQRVIPWFRDNGDKTHRLNYDLDARSVIFDLGGYEGQWASDIFAMYQCRVYIFEPLPRYADNISYRFRSNNRISVHSFGLAAEDGQSVLSVDGDASSVHKSGGEKVTIQLRSVSDFLSANNVEFIDLMKINIEGGEYDLLTQLISSGIVTRICNIQVQFHDFVPGAETRMAEIQEKLAITHELTYQYPFVWENWARRKL